MVDRIESGVGVLEFEDGSVLLVPESELPQGVSEGSYVRVRLERVGPVSPEDGARTSSLTARGVGSGGVVLS